MRGPRTLPLLIASPQIDGVEGAARIHVEHAGEADIEIDLRVGQRPERPRRQACGVATGVDVHMGVDHAGHHGGGAEIDDARAFRNLHIGANVGDAVALDQHHGIAHQRAGFRIEHRGGPNGDDLILRREVFAVALGQHG